MLCGCNYYYIYNEATKPTSECIAMRYKLVSEQIARDENTFSSPLYRRRREAVSVNLKGLVTVDTLESFTDMHID